MTADHWRRRSTCRTDVIETITKNVTDLYTCCVHWTLVLNKDGKGHDAANKRLSGIRRFFKLEVGVLRDRQNHAITIIFVLRVVVIIIVTIAIRAVAWRRIWIWLVDVCYLRQVEIFEVCACRASNLDLVSHCNFLLVIQITNIPSQRLPVQRTCQTGDRALIGQGGAHNVLDDDTCCVRWTVISNNQLVCNQRAGIDARTANGSFGQANVGVLLNLEINAVTVILVSRIIVDIVVVVGINAVIDR